MGDAGDKQDEGSSQIPVVDPIDRVALATEPDWFLQHLVWLANTGGVEAGVTLVCGGTIVSGMLVSGAKYVQGFREEFTSSLAAELISVLDPMFDALAAPYAPTSDDENGLTVERTHYIHLRDARFYAAGQPPIPGNRGVWWRGRLASVSGFSLGQLSAATSET
jgi:hypothetical protein